MGSQESKFYAIPVPVFLFGSETFDDSDGIWDRIAEGISLLRNADALIRTAAIFWANPVLGQIAAFLTGVEPILTLLDSLLGETSSFHREMDNLAIDIFSTIVEGKLNSVKHAVANILSISRLLQNRPDQTTGEQVAAFYVSELSIAVHHFYEFLPIFTNQRGTMYKYYYLATPLFIRICGIFGIIITFAEGASVHGYRNENLNSLKQDYAATLNLYKERCIRQRLRSIHILEYRRHGRTSYSYAAHYYSEDLAQFTEYFTEDTCSKIQWLPWPRYNDEGFEEKILDCSNTSDDVDFRVKDKWDPRPRNEIEFEMVEVRHNEFARRVCTRRYRETVKTLMESRFAEILAIVN